MVIAGRAVGDSMGAATLAMLLSLIASLLIPAPAASTPLAQAPPTFLGRPVLAAAGGTWTFGAQGAAPATLVAYAVTVGDRELIERVSFTLQGPTEWNRGSHHTWEVGVRSYAIWRGHFPLREIPPVPGDYTLSASVNQREGKASIRIDPSKALARPTFRVRVENRRYTVEFDPVLGARYYVVLVERLGTNQADRYGSGRAPDRSTTPFVLPLGRYRVTVSAFSWNPDGTDGWEESSQGVHGSEAIQEFEIR